MHEKADICHKTRPFHFYESFLEKYLIPTQKKIGIAMFALAK
jgi:hypothetical protein